MKRWILWAPLVLFLLFVGVVASGLLKPDDRVITSKMIGEPLPDFALPEAVPGKPALASADFRGKPRLLNIFASWCMPCRIEAPQLDQLARAGIDIEAIAIRDRPEDVARYLSQYGDPYARIGSDTESRVQLALGSSGVPETFVVDARGIIRHQHIGEIRPEHVPEILAKLDAAK